MSGNRKKSEPAARKSEFNKNWYSRERLLPCLKIRCHFSFVLFRILTFALLRSFSNDDENCNDIKLQRLKFDWLNEVINRAAIVHVRHGRCKTTM